MEVVFNCFERPTVAESKQDRLQIDDVRITRSDYLPVPAVDVVTGIVNDAGRNRVEVNVRDNLAEVLVGVDDPGSVPTLPKPSQEAVPPVVGARDSTLKPSH